MYGEYLVVKKTYLALHLMSGEDSLGTAHEVAREKSNQNDTEYLVVHVVEEVKPGESAPEQRDEAVGAVDDRNIPCPNCGVYRTLKDGFLLEKCRNCGDDETDLSAVETIP